MARSQVRASGKTAGTEAADQADDEIFQAMAPEIPEEREKTVSALSFSRMKLDFTRDERIQMARLKAIVDGVIAERFRQVFGLMDELFDKIRQHEIDDNGEMVFDHLRRPVWKKSNTGATLEDWSQLGFKQREDYLFRITTQIFEWEQDKADLWAEAMFAKAMWTEEFSIEYDRSMSGTIEDRTAAANRRAAESKYFAIFSGYLSRKADGIIWSMKNLSNQLAASLPK